jgi:hypothetical protein
MGGVPLLAALVCVFGRYNGTIVSEPAQKLADVVIYGALATALLAIVVATHIVAEFYILRKLRKLRQWRN